MLCHGWVETALQEISAQASGWTLGFHRFTFRHFWAYQRAAGSTRCNTVALYFLRFWAVLICRWSLRMEVALSLVVVGSRRWHMSRWKSWEKCEVAFFLEMISLKQGLQISLWTCWRWVRVQEFQKHRPGVTGWSPQKSGSQCFCREVLSHAIHPNSKMTLLMIRSLARFGNLGSLTC